MIQRVSKTDTLIEQFKTWDGAAWFRHHLAWLKGSYHIASQPVKREKKKAPKVHTIPFKPGVAHASGEIREYTGLTDKEWVKQWNEAYE